jgi:hypothetical protein
VVQQAKDLLERPEVRSLATDEQKLRQVYQIAFQRPPDADELRLATQFLAAQTAAAALPEPPAWSYGYGHFDEATGRMENFTPLPHWTGYAWQGGTNLPDPKLGWVILNADGGHVGNDQNHAAIRRWRAPRDGGISITGELSHPSDKGDGVRARVVSSRLGALGEWTAKNSQTPTKPDRVEVKRGDFLDFVTDCRQSVEFDSFHWAPVIRMLSYPGKPNADERREWNAKSDFSGPAKAPEKRPLTPWEKYAQVLLLANELVFVD